jgi:hypothetical protein
VTVASIFANFHVLFLTLVAEICREMLLQRIRALNDAKMEAFSVDGLYRGAPKNVLQLIDSAIRAYEDNDFALCERICARAEIEICGTRPQPLQPFISGIP